MKKIILTLSIILVSIISHAQFQLNGYIDQTISCYGNNDASIQINAYPLGVDIWTDPPINNVLCKNRNLTTNSLQINNTGFFNGLAPGSYLTCAFIGEDSLCYIFEIEEAIPLDIKFNINTPLSCINKGELGIDITGGTYIIQHHLTTWTNTEYPDSILNKNDNFALFLDNLDEGSYNVLVEDDHGCFFNKTYSLWKQGDINHDSNVDLLDLIIIENDVNNFIFGEDIETDLNKDENVDLLDLNIMERLIIECNN